MQGGDAERGSELNNRPRTRASRQHVKQPAGLSRDGERKIFQAGEESEVIGFALHQACPFFRGEFGHCGTRRWRGCIGLFV